MIDGINEIQYKKSDVILFNSYSKSDSVVLSNHYPCSLKYDNEYFESAEQLFFMMRLSGHTEVQEQILKCKDAKEVKKVGGAALKRLKIKETPEKLVAQLRFCIRLKFNQCDEFRQFLCEHQGKQIVEYSTWGDDTWGAVDVDPFNKWSWYKGYVKGQNICGRLIQETRKEGVTPDGDGYIELPVELPFCTSVHPDLSYMYKLW